MRKNILKKIALWINGLIAGLFVVPGIVTLCTDINGSLDSYIEARADGEEESFFYAEFTNKVYTDPNRSGDIVYAEIRAKAKRSCTINVDYETYSVNAIESIDYVGGSGTEKFEFYEAGEKVQKIAFKSLLTNDTKEILSLRNSNLWNGLIYSEEDAGYYGRHFKVKILKITVQDGSGTTVIEPEKDTGEHGYQNSQYTTCVYLPYLHRTENNFDLGNSRRNGAETNSSAYSSIYDRLNGGDDTICDGVEELDGKSVWRSWEKHHFVGGTDILRDVEYQNFIETGVAKAYGTVMSRSIDTSTFHSNSDISFFWGNKEFFIDHYNKFGETKKNDWNKNYPGLDQGLSMYIKVDPDKSGGYYMDGVAVNYLAEGKNPTSQKDKLINVGGGPTYMVSDKKRLNYKLGRAGIYWLGSQGALYNTTFFRMYPYNGSIQIGIAIYNSNKEVDIEALDIYSAIMLIDDTAPYVKDEWAEYDKEGNIRLYIRFSEAVYPTREKSFIAKVNDTSYLAEYVNGYFSDTLVYQISADQLATNHQKITSITYQLPDDDIADLGWAYDAYGVGYNNKLENTDQERTSKIIGGQIDLSTPHLGVDMESSTAYQNSYDIILSTNSTSTSKDFTDGTVYYSWDKYESWTPDVARNPDKYDNVHVLTEEEKGSFQVTLANVPTGAYYLHALVIPTNGGLNSQIDYNVFGPYNFDKTNYPASLALSTSKVSDLKTKYLTLTLEDKDPPGSPLDTIELVVEYENNDEKASKSLTIVENGDIVSGLESVVSVTDNVYTYISTIDDTSSVLLDPIISELISDTVYRADTTMHFVITDTAGNKSLTNDLELSYDVRKTFTQKTTFPSGYSKQDPFEGINYDVYTFNTIGAISFGVDPSDTDTKGYIDDGARYFVTVNGKDYYAGAGEYSLSLTLQPGLYNIVPHVQEVVGDTITIDLVSANLHFCLTNGTDDMTTNRAKTQDDLVLTNQTYQLDDAKFYYYNNASNTVNTMNYGATINLDTGKYDGGSNYPTFSSIDAAKRYVKYMEKQDLYLIEITDLIANTLNSGSGSTTYVKAPGETTYAQPGQLWIRYKKSTWNNTTDAYSWAFYFYKSSGRVENGINPSELSTLLESAINTVTNRIVSNGKTTYLVEEGTLASGTNAPYLRASQMHAYAESAAQTMSGTFYVSDLKYNGDQDIFKNNVEVLNKQYPLATNMVLSVSSTTSLYYQTMPTDEPDKWYKLDAHDGDLLGSLVGDRNIYRIKEYDSNGVSTFNVYIDHEMPIITGYFTDANDDEVPFVLPDESGETNFSPRKFTITSLTDTDDLAYVAIFSNPYNNLIDVLYAKDLVGNKKYVLSDGNFYVQVGDRSGNIITYTVVTSDSELILEAAENSSQTGVSVKVLNRDEKEIYSYEVYINGELVYTEFVAEAFYRETGIYRIVVTDIYGNTASKTVVHEAPSPDITWYYYVDDDTPVLYDSEHISRMKLIEDETNPRIIFVNSSAFVRAIFVDNNEAATVEFELTGLDKDKGEYEFNEFRNMLTFSTMKTWKLRVWYSTNPESDRIYIFVADNSAPKISGTFIGNSYHPNVVYDEYGNVVSTANFDIIDWDKYPEVGDVITLDYLDYTNEGSTSLSFANGDTISGTQIVLRVSDETGVKSVSATKDGTEIKNLKYDKDTGTIQLADYGEYVITAVDELNNVMTFTFKNIDTGLARGYLDDDTENPIKEDVMNYGHDNLIVETYAEGTQLILIKYGEESYTYELHYEDGLLTYGRYMRFDEKIYNDDNPPALIKTITTAEYVETIGYALSLEDVLRNTWYPVITSTKYTVEAMFDAEGNLYYKVNAVDSDLLVETLFSIGNSKLPSHFKVGLSKKVSSLTLYSGEHEIEEGTNYYIHISETLTIKTTETDPDITSVKYSFSPIGLVHDYTTIYDGTKWEKFIGEEKGYYQIIVTNKYNNVKTYNIKMIDTFGFVIKIHVIDGSDVYYEDQRHEAYSNHSIELIVMSDAVTFEVNGEERGGIYRQDATVLTIEREGQYEVVVVGDNGIREYFNFEILNDETFIYQEDWITGFNTKALLADECYTNTYCTVHPGERVIYIDVSINGELHKLYDEINAQPDKELESLENAIGRYGNGVYKVGFRNRYGDLVIKTIYFSNTPSLVLDRKTTNDPNNFISYDLYTAVNRGFYSNYVLRFSTTSKKYIFKLNGEAYSLDEPRTLEFSNISGTGSFSYKIEFLDEYGNEVAFDAILYREDISMDLSKMKIVTINGEPYTRDDIVVTFDSKLNGVVNVDNGEAKRYVSGTAFYADGKYTFTVTDIAGNRAVQTINHKSVNHYTLTDPSNNDATVITDGVVNYSSVNFTSLDECVIKYVFKDGVLQTGFEGNSFTSTGHWELMIEDAIGNQTYESFYILNNELKEFKYTAPYGYEVTEVWKVESEDTRSLLPISGSSITLNENGSYAVVVTSTKTTSSFNFTVAINDTPPTATLVGVENGGVTARDVSLTGLKTGDVIKVYRNGVLTETSIVGISNTSPAISKSGRYLITVTNIQGVTATYEFVRKPIASASASIFIVVTCVIAMAGLTFGLIHHTKLKTDE